MTACEHTDAHVLIERYSSPVIECDLTNMGGNPRMRIGCFECGRIWTHEWSARSAEALRTMERGDQARIAAAAMRR